MSATVRDNEAPTGNQFSTFGGVFTPSILTILGVIMFMRTGLVVGEAGILHAVFILAIAKVITFLTGLSICAISTNTRVEGGGAYFLISRSLGPGYGGAIGLALFLAQALSVPFYVLGFTEAVVSTFPTLTPHFMTIGLVTTLLIFIINYIGADWAIKAQYGILSVLVLAIITFLGGSLLQFDSATLQANMQPAYSGDNHGFWVIFAIFFPAVTGIMAGVNMSGDLADPAKSIPRGTLSAIGVGFLVYLAQIVITGGAIEREALSGDPYQSLLDSALFGFDFFVVAGVFAATLSSALGSFLGAPRILQALARDDIFPFLSPFSKGEGKGDEPRRGYWLTFVMTVAVLAFAGNDPGGGALNVVAAILTMFFLYTYGMTNMAAFIEEFSKNPSFRPRFRFFHWITALLGAAGCIGAALLINVVAAAVALALILLVFAYTERRVLSTTFGDARRGFYYARVRSNLLQLSAQPQHPKNWRPTTLVLSGNPASRLTLSTYAVWLESGRGIVTLAQVLVGDVQELLKRRREAKEELSAYIETNKLDAFSEVVVASTFSEGVDVMLQAHSLGPLKPNVVMMGWPGDASRAGAFVRLQHLAAELDMSQVVCVDRGLPAEAEDKRIDVWWRGQENGSLMVILAYLLTHNWQWNDAEIRILRRLSPDQDEAAALTEIEELIEAGRIQATAKCVRADSVREAIHRESSDATVVFLGFRTPPHEQAFEWHAQFGGLIEGLPTTLLISSTGEANLLA